MQVFIANSEQQTWLFIGFLIILLSVHMRKIINHHFWHPTLTTEIKGLAILMILFGHIGYFLSTNTQFLYPLSVASGVGVNLFLFLSGLGLTFSQLRQPLSIQNFYLRRLSKLFIPLWVVLTILLLADYFILGRSYALSTTVQHFLGWFPQVDLTEQINSPLWYFTFILFYYLVYPLVWFKRWPYLSAGLLFLISYLVTGLKLPVNHDLIKIYELHYLAFPLGVLTALVSREKFWLRISAWYQPIPKLLKQVVYYLVLATLLAIIAYTAIHSSVGEGELIEQQTSLITAGSIVLLFLLKKVQFKILQLFGTYSYEIYLIHWPILFRYDLFYKFLPGAVATICYLGLFLGLAYLLQKVLSLFRFRL